MERTTWDPQVFRSSVCLQRVQGRFRGICSCYSECLGTPYREASLLSSRQLLQEITVTFSSTS